MSRYHNTTYSLLTFYKFVDVEHPIQEVEAHKQFCKDIGLLWRVYIGEEWISSTVSGNIGQIHAYRLYLLSNPYFKEIPDVDVKAMQVDGHQFEKMIVKYRREIVAMGQPVTQEQVQRADKQISVEELKRIIDEWDENREILDMRNDYERQLGHFKGAIPAGTLNFREVHELVDKYKEKFKDKKVVMYCTWWIRCEKLSVLLHEEGVDNFYGLDGGVVKYTNLQNDGNRLGNLYTFDGRVSCPIGNEETHTTIATCLYTNDPADNCENCRYSPCNARIICDKKQYHAHAGFCSSSCYTNAKTDLLLKNSDRDPVDYKSLRGIIKQDPTQKQAITEQVQSYLEKQLGDKIYKHTVSQKERVLHER